MLVSAVVLSLLARCILSPCGPHQWVARAQHSFGHAYRPKMRFAACPCVPAHKQVGTQIGARHTIRCGSPAAHPHPTGLAWDLRAPRSRDRGSRCKGSGGHSLPYSA